MTDMRRMIRCSNCGTDASVSISSDLEMSELLLAGRCNRCGNSLQLSYSLVERENTSAPPEPEEETINVEDALGTADLPSDTLKDIMEE